MAPLTVEAPSVEAGARPREGAELKRTLGFWWLAAFLILTAVFVSGVLRPQALPRLAGDYPTRPVNSRPHFDRTSETLVENSVDARLLGAPPTPGGFMFRIAGDPRFFDARNPASFDGAWQPLPDDLTRREIYSSQLGLQARLYAAAAGALQLNRSSTFAVLRGAAAALLAAMLATIILLVRREWGSAAAGWSLAFCALSTGFNLFAPSLYWSTFMHVAPAATVSAALLAGVQSRLAWGFAYAVVTALFLAKFLSGFEFMTVTVAAAAMPFLLMYSTKRMSARSLIWRSLFILFSGIAAFAAALTIYDIHHANALGQSGIEHILSRADRWVAPADAGPGGQLTVLAKVLLINWIDFDGYGIPNLVPLAAGALFLFLAAKILIRRDPDSAESRIILTVAAAFLVSLSWIVLQTAHVLFHPRYSAILVAYPFGIFLAGAAARLMARRRRHSDVSFVGQEA